MTYNVLDRTNLIKSMYSVFTCDVTKVNDHTVLYTAATFVHTAFESAIYTKICSLFNDRNIRDVA